MTVFFKVVFLDLIAIPDFGAGAMENWGLITYRETSLLYKENESSSKAKQWVAIVVAHELAHQVKTNHKYILINSVICSGLVTL